MREHDATRRLAYLGLMAALVFASNYARITLPIALGGQTSFTLANIVCCLCGLLLGPVGGLASGLGSALYDLTNPLYAAECWITFLTKGTMGLVAGLAALDFNRAFTVFHAIFFPGKDNWIFDPAVDQIILVMPEVFFRNCALLIGGVLLACCAGLVLWDVLARRRSRTAALR